MQTFIFLQSNVWVRHRAVQVTTLGGQGLGLGLLLNPYRKIAWCTSIVAIFTYIDFVV